MIEYAHNVLWNLSQISSHTVRPVRLTPLLKWAGGKEQELKHIYPLIPPFNTYYEPFVGGGAVFFSIQGDKKLINDKSPELVDLYRMVAESNQDFFWCLRALSNTWKCISELVDKNAVELVNMYRAYSNDMCSIEDVRERIFAFVSWHSGEFNRMVELFFALNVKTFIFEIKRNLVSKTARMKAIESKKGKLCERDILANLESACKSAFYMYLRHLHNSTAEYQVLPSVAAAIFFFVRENAYASMFRYNSQGKFNVPYGGISYNRKDLTRKINYMQSAEMQKHLANTIIENMDFEAFLRKHEPQEDDFIFLDPPYDTEFSTYMRNEFDRKDQERLATYLLDECKAKFVLVIKNTTTIQKLYCNMGLRITSFDKRYLVSFQDRNNREAEHLIITNY